MLPFLQYLRSASRLLLLSSALAPRMSEKALVSSLYNFEVDLSGVLGDCVAAEIAALAHSIWLVTESLFLTPLLCEQGCVL